jgi:hypothetical protein
MKKSASLLAHKTSFTRAATALAGVGIVLFANQGFTQPPNNQQKIVDTNTRLQLLEQNITLLNKINTCDGDGECDVLEMGVRLCGGPSSYLIVSLKNPALSAIKAKLAEVEAVQKELNSIDAPLTCTPAPTAPDAKCEKQVCVERTKK